jgi:hypothetical protein
MARRSILLFWVCERDAPPASSGPAPGVAGASPALLFGATSLRLYVLSHLTDLFYVVEAVDQVELSPLRRR